MRQRHRRPVSPLVLFLAAMGVLVSARAFPSGFQVMTQGARATGMGLAFSGIADDPSAIFYNPAGMGFQEHFGVYLSGNLLTRTDGGLEGANPFPGVGASENIDKQWFFTPDVYAVAPLTTELSFGLGIMSPYGLGLRWENPNESVTKFVSQNAVIKTIDLNPVFSYKLFPQLAIAAGADLRFSKVQLERDIARQNPFTQSFADVAHVKLNSDLIDNTGWGWNVGLMFKPVEALSIGASYRSHINVDYDGTAIFIQRFTGDQIFDALVATQLPQGEHPVNTSIDFPATVNIGAGIHLGNDFVIGLEADWTEWSRFSSLNILFPDGAAPAIDRATLWTDTWAYRVGLEKKFGSIAVRAGYYYDNSPQPTFDVGPLLADNDRNVYSLGFGYDTPQFGLDVGALWIAFRDRDVTHPPQTDNFFATYSETGLVLTGGLRINF